MSTFYAFLGELVLRKYMYKIIQIMLNHFLASMVYFVEWQKGILVWCFGIK